MTDRRCAVEGCPDPVRARGWCEKHYRRWSKWGDPTTTYQRPTCSVDSCDDIAVGHGLCNRHYLKWRKYGDPLGSRTVILTCTIEGCDAPHEGKGLCNRHFLRWKKHGDPETVIVRPRVGCINPDGYRVLGWKDHPLASKPGLVLEHRVLLYDAIGPGVHPCHHCGRPVDWARSYPKDPDALVVDHLDHDRSNNDLANLVPSCQPCNVSGPRRSRVAS